MKFTVILFAILLTGCYQSVNNIDIKKAIVSCKSVDNIVEIRSWADGREFVECGNVRQGFYLDEVVLP